MPLRCITADKHSVHSFELTDAEWEALRAENRRSANLQMPCCEAKVTFKTSKLGKRFFAHKAKAVCHYKPETEHHIRIKEAAVRAAREAGWTAQTEVAGVSADGERWIADVLATSPKGTKIAFEVQWSKQGDQVSTERQQRYERSGIRCLWLFRQDNFLAASWLPAVRVTNHLGNSYLAHVPAGHAGPEGKAFDFIPLNHFRTSVFRHSFRFGVTVGDAARLDIKTSPYTCWKNGCCDVRIVTHFDLWVGPHCHTLTVSDLDGHETAAQLVRDLIGNDPSIGKIKRRYSATMQQKYLSNGCAQCDVILGQSFEHEFWHEEEITHSRSFSLTSEWKKLIESKESYEGSWGVHL